MVGASTSHDQESSPNEATPQLLGGAFSMEKKAREIMPLSNIHWPRPKQVDLRVNSREQTRATAAHSELTVYLSLAEAYDMHC